MTTRFLERNPDLVIPGSSKGNRAEKLMRYLAEVAVNGHPPDLGATGTTCGIVCGIACGLTDRTVVVSVAWGWCVADLGLWFCGFVVLWF